MAAPPSRYQILRTDHRSQGLAIFSTMWLVMTLTVGIGFGWKNPTLTAIFGALTGAILVGGYGYAFVRTGRIRRLYAIGHVVDARVRQVDRNAESVGWADVEYEVDGRAYTTRFTSGQTSYAVGDHVEMLVDPRAPAVATPRLLRPAPTSR